MMHSRSLKLREPVTSTDRLGERSRTLRTIGSAPDNDVPALLRRVDIVDAVWRSQNAHLFSMTAYRENYHKMPA